MAFVAYDDALGRQAILFYLAAYLFMTIGSFGVVIAATRKGDECNTLQDLSGLAKQNPLLAGMMSVFMLSLAGMPFTAGFFGKLWLFGAAIQSQYYALAIVGIVTTVFSFYYYLRIIVYMYMHDAEEDKPFDAMIMSHKIALSFAALALLVYGIFPNWLWKTITMSTGNL
jgi:NADH-quinone oxidoreductase subunit N